MLTLLVKFALNGFALFGSIIALYFQLSRMLPERPYLTLIIVGVLAAVWGLESMIYFRNAFSKLAAKKHAETDVGK